ncbi:MAG: tetratricopeptide repeat protein [Planctomycetaceae bacterium]|nr:tetratricopeptide repeat protein [Planctomycetaceae bacterium]
MGDSKSYSDWGQRIAGGDLLGQDVFYQSPLYPYTLGGIYWLWGFERLPVLVFQAVSGAVACVILADAARRSFGRAAGMATGIIATFYAPALFFDMLVQKSSLDTLLFASLIWALVIAIKQNGPSQWSKPLLLGVTFGLVILNRENAIVLLPVVLWVCLRWLFQRGNRADLVLRSIRPLGFLATGASIVLLPVAFRNAFIGGQFHLTTSQFGPNFFIGNNADANGMYQPVRQGGGNAAFERTDATEIAEDALGYTLSPSQVSSYWTGKALTFIREHPVSWLKLMGRKFLLLANAEEITDTEDLQTYSEWSTPLRLTRHVFHFGTLFPLAVFGVLAGRRNSAIRVIAFAVALYAISVLAFYVMGRYRYPLAVLLFLPAGLGIQRLADISRHLIRNNGQEQNSEVSPVGSTPRRLQTFAAFSTVALAGLIAGLPIVNADHMASVTSYNVALEFDRINDLEKASEYYRRAIRLRPIDAEAWLNLADVESRRGDLSVATRCLEESVRIDRTLGISQFRLANLYVQQDRFVDAIVCYERCLELEPEFPPAYMNLAIALRTQGEPDQAVEVLQRAVHRFPDYLPVVMNLIDTLCEVGRTDEALPYWRKIKSAFPGEKPLTGNLERPRQAERESDQEK